MASSSDRIARLFALYEECSRDITDQYAGFEQHKPAEIRLFAISANSMFVQALGALPEDEMRDVVEKFVDYCITDLLRYMPSADYALVYHAFSLRFPEYAPLIVGLHNAEASDANQDAGMSLVMAMDHHFGVERGAFEASIAGMALSLRLAELAVEVSKAARA